MLETNASTYRVHENLKSFEMKVSKDTQLFIVI